MSEEKQVKTVAGGCGPNFEITDLPEPPRDLNFKKLFAILGPAVIALGGTIGGGEWLVGPSLFVKWGLALLWITTISSLLQVFLNLEMTRYTLYTGEPITVGFMRLKPGKAFWGWLFTIVGFCERGLPGWILGFGNRCGCFWDWVKFPELQKGNGRHMGFYIICLLCSHHLYWEKDRTDPRMGQLDYDDRRSWRSFLTRSLHRSGFDLVGRD